MQVIISAQKILSKSASQQWSNSVFKYAQLHVPTYVHISHICVAVYDCRDPIQEECP